MFRFEQAKGISAVEFAKGTIHYETTSMYTSTQNPAEIHVGLSAVTKALLNLPEENEFLRTAVKYFVGE